MSPSQCRQSRRWQAFLGADSAGRPQVGEAVGRAAPGFRPMIAQQIRLKCEIQGFDPYNRFQDMPKSCVCRVIGNAHSVSHKGLTLAAPSNHEFSASPQFIDAGSWSLVGIVIE